MIDCVEIVSRHFEILEVKRGGGRLAVHLGLPLRGGDLEDVMASLYKDLTASGCYPYFSREELGLVLYIHRPEAGARRRALALALAAATLATVYMSGLALSDPSRGLSWSPLAYLVGLLFPLLVHEMGHWIVMRLNRVPASLPYMIPAPPLQLGFLGTFGAVINMRWLPPTLDSLTVMAVMGPLAGFVVAVPLAVVGLQHSLLLPPQEAAARGDLIGIPLMPLVMLLLGGALGLPSDRVVVLSPLAFASYVVFIVTFLNLIPVGMLDGGHIIRGVVGERMHQAISLLVVVASLLASVYMPQLSLFALLALLIYMMTAGRHPGAAIKISVPGWRSVASALIYSLLLVLTFPLPLSLS
ncbi:site-2 protease family protein [Aeropyrum camini]|uniref:Predicted membrane-associated Zn-dependent protease n=1 Tax=Aeropyrum camini SY1 = JCM 12091 TaxID=1198449 RepID=U3T967_9CREN|nr:site-2 protease family protein [Aeropyrum camini]BAN90067.1 predicted membrane-associated Zn-dependent protease [Aeropyrum camini SY1 = JCM 12091]